MNDIIAVVAALFCYALFLFWQSRTRHPLLSAGCYFAVGAGGLLLASAIGGVFGLQIAVNIHTTVISLLLGLPGVCLVTVLSIAL
jgi:pro-sigmaK processing inhibitor BofA